MRNSRLKDSKRLLKEGANLNFVDESGRTALHFAVSLQNPEFLSLIHDAVESFEIFVNIPDYKGNTSLHYAVQNGDEISISFLVQNGADMYQRNMYGESSMRLASDNQRVYALLINSDSLRSYMKRGRDDECDKQGTKRKKLE